MAQPVQFEEQQIGLHAVISTLESFFHVISQRCLELAKLCNLMSVITVSHVGRHPHHFWPL